jgi:hypothetical protein
MKTVEEYFEYLKLELSKNESPFCKSVLEKVKVHQGENLSDITKMLFFLYKVEGIKIANYKEWQRIV